MNMKHYTFYNINYSTISTINYTFMHIEVSTFIQLMNYYNLVEIFKNKYILKIIQNLIKL